MPALKIAITELAIVAVGSALIIMFYAWAHPGAGYSILFLALAAVAVLSAWTVRQATTNLGLRRWVGVVVVAGCTVVVTFVSCGCPWSFC